MKAKEFLKKKKHLESGYSSTEYIARMMQEFSDQENARLTVINEKQAELINRFLKGNLEIPMRDYSEYQKFKDELASLQSVEKEEIIKIDINDPDFNEPI